ncbi:CopM family metallochaperone [Halotalea alkalilenta]|uniref:CopM family metallochaperone n=1 Tax=Halotalea alkalilenta TaxID=376489 RepID=UPI0004895399|nr:DUF305 domain-containing protein [Halotalea alkalilenta]
MLSAKMIAPLVLAGFTFGVALPATAQMSSMDHGSMGHGSMDHSAAGQGSTEHGSTEHGTAQGVVTPSTEAFEQAAQRMHDGMDIDYSGNADVDFVRGMIAHHQGAIEMAKVQLEYGKDSEMRQLAENVIRDQQREIEQMQRWLEEHDAD